MTANNTDITGAPVAPREPWNCERCRTETTDTGEYVHDLWFFDSPKGLFVCDNCAYKYVRHHGYTCDNCAVAMARPYMIKDLNEARKRGMPYATAKICQNCAIAQTLRHGQGEEPGESLKEAMKVYTESRISKIFKMKWRTRKYRQDMESPGLPG